jgi:D-3-phosphoglycerate dehydrogenase
VSDDKLVSDSRPVVGLLGVMPPAAVRAEIAALLEKVPAVLVDFGVLPTGPGIAGLIAGPEAPVAAADVDVLPGLRVVAAPSTGTDHIAIDAVTAQGGWVINVPDYCTQEVADHAIALVLALLRGIVAADRSVRAGRWQTPPGVRRVAGTRLGLIGFGRIGQAVARRATALGMVVSAYHPEVDDDRFARLSVHRHRSVVELLADVDVASLHVPLTEATRGLVDAQALASMATGSWLVNVSRGGVVDQGALVAALGSGHLAGAGLDVFEQEPPATDDPLLSLSTVALTPHMAWASPDADRAAFVGAARGVAAVLAGAVPDNVVGRPTSII